MKFLKKRLIQENHNDKYIWVHPKEAGESRQGKGEGKKFHIKPPESVFTQNQVKTRGAQKSSQRFYFFDSLPFYLLVSNHKPLLSIYILLLFRPVCDVESAADLTGPGPLLQRPPTAWQGSMYISLCLTAQYHK